MVDNIYYIYLTNSLLFREVKDLERRLQSSKLEKDDLSRDLCEAQEKMKLQEKIPNYLSIISMRLRGANKKRTIAYYLHTFYHDRSIFINVREAVKYPGTQGLVG